MQFVLFLAQSSPSPAAEFTPNSNDDANNLEPGNGLCVAYLLPLIPPFFLPVCTLRAAIEEANALPGSDSINLSPGTYRLLLDGINEDNASTGDLDITDSLLIKGSGIDRTFVDGNMLDRIFDIGAPNAEVTIQYLTVMNGTLPDGLSNPNKGGGGIRNKGNLTLRNVTVKDNQVKGSEPGDSGGGVSNSAICRVVNSSVKENFASRGGGIFNSTGASLRITASTLNNNRALFGAGFANRGTAKIVNTTISTNSTTLAAFPYGGGIHNTADMEILQSTIVNNSSKSFGGGLSNQGYLNVTNTIIAGNKGTNCYLGRPLYSSGNNLEDADTCYLRGPNDLTDTDPVIDNLQDHGGSTETHGLLISSPAVDAGQDLSQRGIIADQRGIRRPDGEAYDIGAFETKKRSITPLLTPLLCCSN